MKKLGQILIINLLVMGMFPLLVKSQPYLNTNLSFEERVNDLVARMTLEEKISQMMHNSPAIERLGIPSYNWWNECLHGVGRAGLATVFPQAIALAATFDSEAMLKTAEIISDEARAKHHDFVKKGQRDIYQGLTFWTPNINIFRDPRWGRGQETYGEDPYLTSIMGEAFVKGLQGNNPKYYKLIATAKHYAVHSGPEYERHTFNVSPADYDFWDTYMPAFGHLVNNAKVYSVMCAYNRYDGEPCCASPKLEMDILRNQWGFNGYIVSDCGAIDDIYKTHKVSPNAVDASAGAVYAGTDLECGNSYEALLEAVKNNRISEQDIDVAVKRLFLARMKLGMFDPDDSVSYSKIPYSVVDSETHRLHSLQMARKSIVLLKNENHTLPLSKNSKTIAVIGPNADNATCLLGNYNGTPSYIVTPLQGIKNKLSSNTNVIYYKGVNLTNDTLATPIDLSNYLTHNGVKGLQAEYYNNIKFEGEPILVRSEQFIDFTGDVHTEIAPNILAKWISVRWTGEFVPSQSGEYSFSVTGDDGFRLFVNNQKVIDHFSYHEAMTDYYTFAAKAGEKYKICLEYFQGDQGARIQFGGVVLHKTDMQQLADKVKQADAIIFIGGISPEIEGEEMPVSLPGFVKGDRTSIALPTAQTQLLKHLHATGKPVIFVMQTGSALAVKWEKENLPAILTTWYGGQDAGTALADVLFGDYNPAGRLPVTFYESDTDLPPYTDYSMQNRTYRYFAGKPLFPFGYGLSYTQFEYSNIKAPKTINTGDSLTIQVTLRNVGKQPGDEVVQVYLSHPEASEHKAIHSLVSFKRVQLNAGETKNITLTISPQSMSRVICTSGTCQRIIKAEDISLVIGGQQPNTTNQIPQVIVKLTGNTITLKP